MSFISSSSLSYVLLVIVGVLFVVKRQLKPGKLPPGPSGLPVLGSVLEIPTRNSWFYFTRLKELFGVFSIVNALASLLSLESSQAMLYILAP